MRPARVPLSGIAASCAAILVAFLIALSWPGAAVQPRSSGTSPAASVTENDVSSRTTSVTSAQADDQEFGAIGDHSPVLLAGTVALALIGWASAVAGRRDGDPQRVHLHAHGRAPPALSRSPRPAPSI